MLAGPTEWLVSRERLTGHTAALADVGVLQDASLVASVPPTIEEGRVAAAACSAGTTRRPRSCASTTRSPSVRCTPRQDAGLRVPTDVSIVGFDDSDLSRATTPELTTVRQPLAEMGRVAVSRLLRLVDRQPIDALHVELGTTLIVRGSSGRPRKA